jgi:hypothetical protein
VAAAPLGRSSLPAPVPNLAASALGSGLANAWAWLKVLWPQPPWLPFLELGVLIVVVRLLRLLLSLHWWLLWLLVGALVALLILFRPYLPGTVLP